MDMEKEIQDIGCDTDRILDMLGDGKMGEGFDSGALMGMLANKGVDPAVVAMLNDKCRDGGWGEQGGIWIILLFLFILGAGGGGFFGRNGLAGDAGVAGVDRTVVNEANYSRLLDAIGTQGTRQEMAVQGLAQTLNCDVGQIRSALCSIDKQLAVNQGSIINAIQNVGCQIGHQISECCCRTNANIDKGFCSVNNNIQGLAYQIQTTDAATRQFIQQSFCDQNAYLAQQFRAIESREDAREIQALRDKNEELRANANTQAILTAIANKDTIAYTGTITGSNVAGSGTIS